MKLISGLNNLNAAIASTGIVLMFLTGIARDYIFIHVNKQISNGTSSSLLFSGNGLIMLKWFLTACFSLIYFLITFFAVKLIFKNKTNQKTVILFYLALIGFALFLVLAGVMIHKTTESYRISRDIMGLVQSPFLLMVLIPAFYLQHKNDVEKK